MISIRRVNGLFTARRGEVRIVLRSEWDGGLFSARRWGWLLLVGGGEFDDTAGGVFIAEYVEAVFHEEVAGEGFAVLGED